jgi:hypothetical protein
MKRIDLLEIGSFPHWFKYRHTLKDKTPKTLLGLFFVQKVMEYVEPQREGTARGDAIGFSSQKHGACLSLALYNVKLKRVAEEWGVSYGLLRNWHGEDEFKKMMKRHRREFVAVWIDWLKLRDAENESLWKEALSRPVSDTAYGDNVCLGYREFSDFDEWNETLQVDIALTFCALVKINQYPLQLMGFSQYLGPESPELLKAKSEARKVHKRRLFEDIKEILLKPDLDNRDRNQILLGASILAEYGEDENA